MLSKKIFVSMYAKNSECSFLILFDIIMQIMNNLRNETRDYLCPDQEYYNDMATLMFNPHETVIKLLFHHNGSAEAIFS